ncbi:MAG: hypothetical protein ACKO4W_10020, partial [Bacteroidota bacterium]
MKNNLLVLSDDFRHILDALEKSDSNLFVTGKAGTGKSTLLQLFRSTSRKKLAVLAPTMEISSIISTSRFLYILSRSFRLTRLDASEGVITL